MTEKKKVLIVDDETDLCLLLKDYFERKNYEVALSHTLSDGREMLSTIKPDVLFLDNNLPDEEGWNHAASFAAQFPATFIVLASAYHPDVPAMPVNAHYTVIEKPISFSDLDEQLAAQ
jgi:DNA-binding NtrC family response regulator